MNIWRSCLNTTEKKQFFSRCSIFKITTESNTGKKILAVLKFDVTSVNNPLITIINMMTPARGIFARNLRACATLSDSFDTWNADATERPAPSKSNAPHGIFLARLFQLMIGWYVQSSWQQKKRWIVRISFFFGLSYFEMDLHSVKSTVKCRKA